MLQSLGSRELRWQSDTELVALGALLAAAVDVWRADWELPAQSSVGVTRAWEPALARRDSLSWQAFACDGAGTTVAWLEADAASQHAALARSLFRSEKAQGSEGLTARFSIAGAVAQQALESLLTALGAALKLQHLASGQSGALPIAPPATDRRAWSGAVQVQVRWGHSPEDGISVHLGSGALVPMRRRSPTPASHRPALNDLFTALRARPVQLRATLTDTAIELGQLLSLQAGDVLVTAHRLAQPLQVAARPARTSTPFATLYACHIGTRDGHMALALADPSRLEISDELPRPSSRSTS